MAGVGKVLKVLGCQAAERRQCSVGLETRVYGLEIRVCAVQCGSVGFGVVYGGVFSPSKQVQSRACKNQREITAMQTSSSKPTDQ